MSGVEFPIRKTASEPNLKVKSMLKQKLSQERRNYSPLMSRRRQQMDKMYSNSPLSGERNGGAAAAIFSVRFQQTIKMTPNGNLYIVLRKLL